MLVFVDESGDPGVKIQAGSSAFFVVTLVIFNDGQEAEAVDQRVDLLRRELRFHPRFEFRFNKLKPMLRRQFLEAVLPYDFFYFAICVNKAGLYGEGFKHKEPFYKYTCSLVFENAKPHLDQATVVIDGSGSREFRRQLERYLKLKINQKDKRYIKKVKIQASDSNNLVQLADMVSGAVYRSFGDKGDALNYRRIISQREIYVQTWPKIKT